MPQLHKEEFQVLAGHDLIRREKVRAQDYGSCDLQAWGRGESSQLLLLWGLDSRPALPASTIPKPHLACGKACSASKDTLSPVTRALSLSPRTHVVEGGTNLEVAL